MMAQRNTDEGRMHHSPDSEYKCNLRFTPGSNYIRLEPPENRSVLCSVKQHLQQKTFFSLLEVLCRDVVTSDSPGRLANSHRSSSPMDATASLTRLNFKPTCFCLRLKDKLRVYRSVGSKFGWFEF